MGREAAVVTTWKNAVTGREKEAIDSFMDWMTHMGKHAAEGHVTQPEAYLSYDGSGGMSVVRGSSDKLLELWDSDEFRTLIARVQLTVNDVTIQMYAAGDSVTDAMQRFAGVAGELGYMP